MSKVAPALVALTLLLAGCGGDAAEESDEAGTSGSASATAEVDPADQAIADEAVLTLQDFPAGWEAAEPEDEPSDLGRKEIVECMGVEYGEMYNDATARAESREFTSPDDVEISNQVGIASDEEWAKDAFELAASEEFRSCAAEELQKSMKDSLAEDDQEFELGEVTVNELGFGSYGDASTAMRVTIPIKAEGLSIDATLDFVAVRVGRAQTLVNAAAVISSVSPEELSQYVEIATKRLTQGLDGQ